MAGVGWGGIKENDGGGAILIRTLLNVTMYLQQYNNNFKKENNN
jgi:hypothetical protein